MQSGATQFALKLTSQLYKKGQNLVVSPFSLSYALSMLSAGADGNSRNELLETLFADDAKLLKDSANLESKYASICQALVDDNAAVLKNTNLLYLQLGYPLREAFLKALQSDFKAVSKVLDFEKANHKAVDTINNDVKKATNGMIPKLMDSVAADTKVILGNAIHFKGMWKSKFDANKTEPMDFHRSDGTTIQVPMMFAKSEHFPYYSDEKLQAVQLDYTAGSISMLLVLPKEGNTVSSLLSDLHAAKLQDIEKNMRSGIETHLWLPKFKLDSFHQLVSVLSKLGIRDVFGSQANLSKIQESGPPLFVSDIIQSAVIEVNEEGTEAAAATMIMMRMMMIKPTHDFKLDRPFLYFLIDRQSNSLLFSGVVEDPSSK